MLRVRSGRDSQRRAQMSAVYILRAVLGLLQVKQAYQTSIYPAVRRQSLALVRGTGAAGRRVEDEEIYWQQKEIEEC